MIEAFNLLNRTNVNELNTVYGALVSPLRSFGRRLRPGPPGSSNFPSISSFRSDGTLVQISHAWTNEQGVPLVLPLFDMVTTPEAACELPALFDGQLIVHGDDHDGKRRSASSLTCGSGEPKALPPTIAFS